MRARSLSALPFALLVVAGSLLGCGSRASRTPPPALPPTGSEEVVVGPPAPTPGGTTAEATLPRLESTHTIPDEATWRQLAARPATATVARTEVVKFLLDTQHDRVIWFVDTERYDIHFDFAVARLGLPGGWQAHGDFNTREYRRPERRFEMGSLVHYADADIWAMEMVAGDNLSGERLVRMFEDVRRAVFFGDRLRFRPLSPQQPARARERAARPDSRARGSPRRDPRRLGPDLAGAPGPAVALSSPPPRRCAP